MAFLSLQAALGYYSSRRKPRDVGFTILILSYLPPTPRQMSFVQRTLCLSQSELSKRLLSDSRWRGPGREGTIEQSAEQPAEKLPSSLIGSLRQNVFKFIISHLPGNISPESRLILQKQPAKSPLPTESQPPKAPPPPREQSLCINSTRYEHGKLKRKKKYIESLTWNQTLRTGKGRKSHWRERKRKMGLSLGISENKLFDISLPPEFQSPWQVYLVQKLV